MKHTLGMQLIKFSWETKIKTIKTFYQIEINFPDICANISNKISHLDCFPQNLGNVSGEQSLQFYQNIKEIETL